MIPWEADWSTACQDESLSRYFTQHFDDTDPNDPRARHSPGLAYAAEVSRAMTPAPVTRGPALDHYATEINREPTDPQARLWRALVGNQKELLPQLQEIIGAELKAAGPFSEGGEKPHALKDKLDEQPQQPHTYLDKERFDKVYDFGKAVLGLSLEGEHPNAIQSAFRKYGWLSRGWGDRMASYGLSVWTGMMAASGAMNVLRAAQWGLGTAGGKKLTDRVLNAALVQRMLEGVLRVTVEGGHLKVPMLVGVRYPAQEAMVFLTQRPATDFATLVPHGGVDTAQGNKVTLFLLTDSDELERFNGDVEQAIKGGAGKVSVGAVAGGGAFKTQPGALPRLMTREAFERLWKARRLVKDIGAGVTAWDGRLALGAVLINLFAVKKSIGEVKEENTGTEEERARKHVTAVLGLLDAIGGTLGAGLEVAAVIAKTSIASSALRAALTQGKTAHEAAEIAEEAVKKSLTMAEFRLGAAVFGTMGSVFAIVSAFRKIQDSTAAGQDDVARLYFASLAGFGATLVPSVLSGAGAVAEILLKKQAESAVARRVITMVGEKAVERTAERFGAVAAAEVLGLSIPGFGWICLGIALGFEAWAVSRTPTPLQVWVSRSYFGKGTGTDSEHKPFPKGQWKVECDALMKLASPQKKEEVEHHEEKPESASTAGTKK